MEAEQQHIIKRLGRAYWGRLATHHRIRRFRRKTIKLHNRLTGLTEHNDEIQVWESSTADDLFSAIFDQHLTDQEEEEMVRDACRFQGTREQRRFL